MLRKERNAILAIFLLAKARLSSAIEFILNSNDGSFHETRFLEATRSALLVIVAGRSKVYTSIVSGEGRRSIVLQFLFEFFRILGRNILPDVKQQMQQVNFSNIKKIAGSVSFSFFFGNTAWNIQNDVQLLKSSNEYILHWKYMQICILVLPFRIRKKKQKKKNASTKTITVIQIRPSSSSSGFQKRFQNHKISAYTHLLSSFLPFFLPSFLLPIIQYLRGDTAADRLFPTDILDSCFLENLPSPILLSEDRARVVDWHDTTRHEWRPWHSINRTKTNNVRHACELWSGEESSSPSPPTRCYSTAIMTRDQRALKLPLPSPLLPCCVPRCKRERGISRGERNVIAPVHFRALSNSCLRRQRRDELFVEKKDNNCKSCWRNMKKYDGFLYGIRYFFFRWNNWLSMNFRIFFGAISDDVKRRMDGVRFLFGFRLKLIIYVRIFFRANLIRGDSG